MEVLFRQAPHEEPRHPMRLSYAHYNAKVDAANRQLELWVARHRSASFNEHDRRVHSARLLDADGVHMQAPSGARIYWRSLRGAILPSSPILVALVSACTYLRIIASHISSFTRQTLLSSLFIAITHTIRAFFSVQFYTKVQF